MTTKYTTEEVKQLYSIAVDQGWDALESNEKIAVGRYCRKHGINRPGLEPQTAPSPLPEQATETPAPQPAEETQSTQTQTETGAEPITGEQYFKHLGLGGGVRGNGDQQARNTPNRRRHRIRHRSGTAAQRPVHRTLARRHRDHPCANRQQMEADRAGIAPIPRPSGHRRRRQKPSPRPRTAPPPAQREIRRLPAKGSYRVEIAPDRRHKDCYVVIAQYRGAEQ